MKKLLSAFLCITMLFGLAGCGSAPQEKISIPAQSDVTSESGSASTNAADLSSNASDAEPSNENGKTLVVYFSVPETTQANNLTTEEENSVVVINGEVFGNTQYVAYVIAENTGAHIFRIEAKKPYTTNHEALVNQAKEEQNQNARPELNQNVENLSQYDTVFIGYPNWWGDMPMILYTFFDDNDFSGKTIIPFNTHGGSGFSGTIGAIAELEPNATVNQEGFTVSRNAVQDAEPNIISWLEKLGY